MKCKRKMQKRRDVLTVIGMMILLAFILRMWPILLLMLIGVFFYALWMLFHMDAAPQQPAQAPLMAQPPPASEESVLNTGFLGAPAQDHRAGAAAVSQCQMGVGCCRCPGAVRPRRRAEHPAQPRRRIPESGGAGEQPPVLRASVSNSRTAAAAGLRAGN